MATSNETVHSDVTNSNISISNCSLLPCRSLMTSCKAEMEEVNYRILVVIGTALVAMAILAIFLALCYDAVRRCRKRQQAREAASQAYFEQELQTDSVVATSTANAVSTPRVAHKNNPKVNSIEGTVIKEKSYATGTATQHASALDEDDDDEEEEEKQTNKKQKTSSESKDEIEDDDDNDDDDGDETLFDGSEAGL